MSGVPVSTLASMFGESLDMLDFVAFHKAIEIVNRTLIRNLAPRLNDLFEYQLKHHPEQNPVIRGGQAVVVWEDITIVGTVNNITDVVVTGTRLFDTGDVVIVEGEEVELDDTTSNAYGMKILIKLNPNAFRTLTDTTLPIDEVVRLNELIVQPQDIEMDKPVTTRPPSVEANKQQYLFEAFERSKTKH